MFHFFLPPLGDNLSGYVIVGDGLRYYDTSIGDLRMDKWINGSARIDGGFLSRGARTIVMV